MVIKTDRTLKCNQDTTASVLYGEVGAERVNKYNRNEQGTGQSVGELTFGCQHIFRLWSRQKQVGGLAPFKLKH